MKWAYLKNSQCWWKVPPMRHDYTCNVICQNSNCKRCTRIIPPISLKENLENRFGYSHNNKIYCYNCIHIIRSKKNISRLLIKREISREFYYNKI